MTLFNKIYESSKTAIIRDEKALTEILIDINTCVDTYENDVSPIYRLATEKNHKAVNSLLRRNASLSEAAKGYAEIGCFNKVNDLLSKGADPSKVIIVYAKNGFYRQVTNLIEKQNASSNSALEGYAQSRHPRASIEIEKIIKNKQNDKYFYLCFISLIKGYVFAEKHDEVNKIIDEGKLPKALDHAAKFYALIGSTDKANEMKKRGASSESLVCGYALSGNEVEVNKIIQQENYPQKLIQQALIAYAQGGHAVPVYELLECGYNKDDAAWGFAFGFHVKQVNHLIAHGADQQQALKGYQFGNHFKHNNLLRLLALTDNNEFRVKLAEFAKQEFGITTDVTQANTINNSMQKYHLSFEQAKTWMCPQFQTVQSYSITKLAFPFALFKSYLTKLSLEDLSDLENKMQLKI